MLLLNVRIFVGPESSQKLQILVKKVNVVLAFPTMILMSWSVAPVLSTTRMLPKEVNDVTFPYLIVFKPNWLCSAGGHLHQLCLLPVYTYANLWCCCFNGRCCRLHLFVAVWQRSKLICKVHTIELIKSSPLNAISRPFCEFPSANWKISDMSPVFKVASTPFPDMFLWWLIHTNLEFRSLKFFN